MIYAGVQSMCKALQTSVHGRVDGVTSQYVKTTCCIDYSRVTELTLRVSVRVDVIHWNWNIDNWWQNESFVMLLITLFLLCCEKFL